MQKPLCAASDLGCLINARYSRWFQTLKSHRWDAACGQNITRPINGREKGIGQWPEAANYFHIFSCFFFINLIGFTTKNWQSCLKSSSQFNLLLVFTLQPLTSSVTDALLLAAPQFVAVLSVRLKQKVHSSQSQRVIRPPSNMFPGLMLFSSWGSFCVVWLCLQHQRIANYSLIFHPSGCQWLHGPSVSTFPLVSRCSLLTLCWLCTSSKLATSVQGNPEISEGIYNSSVKADWV